MGFAHHHLGEGEHRFVRDLTVIVHASVRGAGFDLHFVMGTAQKHGVWEELEDTLASMGDELKQVPYPPPDG